MSITLENRARRPQTFILLHGVACHELDCRCTRQTTGTTDHDAATGERKLRAVTRKLAGSVTLMARGHDGDHAYDLPPGVAMLADVRAAVARGELVVHRDGSKPRPPPPKDEPQAVAAPPPDEPAAAAAHGGQS